MSHFILPFLSYIVSPKLLIRRVLDIWFTNAARLLRISAFLFGGEFPNELPEDEMRLEDARIFVRYLTGNPARDSDLAPRLLRPNVTNVILEDGTVELVDIGESDEWEDEKLDEPDEIPVPVQPTIRHLRYIRVPNHDHIEVIPGYKMLVRLHRNDPVFGRPNETPLEVIANWTKVYAPDQFRLRVNN